MIMMGDRKKLMSAILGPESDEMEGEEPDALHAISQEAIECVLNHDVAGFADCLRAAFELLDSEPHVEGPHEE